uniref:Dystroglycan 1 n=1 Tax=Eptatretus burgeri TaxID=7764 RepID=A0A8C4QQ16_EPTBU
MVSKRCLAFRCSRLCISIKILVITLGIPLCRAGNADVFVSNGDENQIEASLYHTLHNLDDVPHMNPEKVWTIPDVAALVGYAFQLNVPRSPRYGDVGPLKVTEAGKEKLPPWLMWDNGTRSLFGLPLEDDAGLYFIAISTMNNTFMDSEVFTISVVSNKNTVKSNAKLYFLTQMSNFACKPEETVTVLTVIIDADAAKMNPFHRLELLKQMQLFSKVKTEEMKLMPVVNNKLFDMSAFMAGPGNAKKMTENGALLSWELGCSLDETTVPNIMSVEESARRGTMAKHMGYPVLGWHIANHKTAVVKRVRRRLHVTPTPTFTVPLPTHPVTGMPPRRIIPTPLSPAFKTTQYVPIWHPGPGHIITHTVTVTPSRGKPTVYTTPALYPIVPTSVSTTTTVLGTIQPTAVYPDFVQPTVAFVPTAQKPRPPISTKVALSKPAMTTTRKPRVKTPVYKKTTPAPTTPFKSITTTAPIAKITTKATTTTSRTTTRIIPDTNKPPILMNHIDQLDVYLGTYFQFKIPYDTFFDHIDGTTDKLKLVLSASKTEPVGKMSWVQLNTTSQVLFGLPPNDEKLIGKHEYILTAMDKGGKKARDALEIIVHQKPNDGLSSAIFNITLDHDYNAIAKDLFAKIKLMKTLAKAFGDRNVSALTIRELGNGTFIEWINNTLPLEPCPKREIMQLAQRIGTNDGKPTKIVEAAMKPDFQLVSVTVVGSSDCEGISFVPVRQIPRIAPPTSSPEPPVEGPERTSQDDVYLNTVIPAVVVAAILLIAGIIAMICYRKKRKGRLSEEDQAMFIKKGVPIIFADELDDSKPTASSSMPLILTEEKPPLPPPEYPCQLVPGNLTLGDDFICETTPLREEDPNAPPYQPPPPFSSAQESRSLRPKNMTRWS